MVWLDPPGQCHTEVHPKYFYLSKNGPERSKKGQIRQKWQKKGDFVRQYFPRGFFVVEFLPVHLVGLSERFVLDPKTIIWKSVFMEIWLKEYHPLSDCLAKNSFFLPIKIWSERSLKIMHKLRVLRSKYLEPSLKCTDRGPIRTY